jgi:replicative DNA helicase
MDEIAIKLIGSILKDKFLLLSSIKNGLEKELFSAYEEKILVDYILKKYGKKEAIPEPTLIKTEFEESGIYSTNLGKLVDKATTVTPLNLESLIAYIDILKKRKSEERLMSIGKRIESYIKEKEQKKDLTEFTGEIINEVHDIMRRRVKKRLNPVRTQLIMFSSEVESRESDKNFILGYSLEPFHCLNETLSGARPGFYYALAGAPRRGKTNFMLRIASYIASNEHVPILFYSWEQTSRVLFLRIFSQETLIPPYVLETTNVISNPELKERFNRGYAKTESYMNYL